MDIQGMCAEALEQVVREVAARVVASIKAQQDQALVVYTGAKIGYATATEQLAQLRERLGLSYTVLMSEPAARVLDVDAIDEALKPADLVIERSGSKSAESMARDAGMIIVPALTWWPASTGAAPTTPIVSISASRFLLPWRRACARTWRSCARTA